MKKVLLVNDSKFESLIMKDTLSKIGYNVSVADEYDAVVKIQAFGPDYVIINRVMKEIYGDELASMIKVRYPDVKCILSSCDSINSDNYNKAGIDAVIKTPIDKSKLELVLKNIE